MAKDFLVTDVVCKELTAIGYNCLVQIKTLQQCCHVSMGEKTREDGGNVKVTFYSDRHCR